MDRDLNDFANYIEEWIWETDRDSIFTYCSSRCEEILGYKPEEVVGMSSFDFMPQGEVERFNTLLSDYVANHQPFFRLKNYFLHKDGSNILLEVSGRPYFREGNEFSGYRGTSRTIGEKASDSIEKQVYEAMLDSLSEASVSVDKNGIIKYANQAFFELFGYARDELYGSSISCLDAAETTNTQSVSESLNQIHAQGFLSAIVKRKRKDGQLIDVQARAVAVKNDQGEIIRVVGSYMDLSQFNELKESLADTANELYETVNILEEKQFELEAAQRIAKLGSWTLDIVSGEVFWTKELYRMMGTNPDLPPPNYTEHSQLFTKASWNLLDSSINNAVKMGKAYEVELQLSRDGDSDYWIRAMGEPRRTRDGQVMGLRGVAVDITDQKRAEAHVKKTMEDLHKAIDGSVELAMTIGELKDPYTAGHEQRVASLAVAIGEKLKLDWKTLLSLKYVGQLHDIGKIRIPSELLAKPGKITDLEFALIKEHTSVGWEILKTVNLPWPAAEVAL